MVNAVLLTHGAGSDRDHHTLLALADALAPTPVERIDFPYRREGRKAPDRAPKLVSCISDEAAALAERVGCDLDEIVYGGRSLGGRMCSLAVAEGLPAAGLVLISYPLHPPGKPDKMRVDHLPDIDVPCLFVSGDRDPFGTPAELELATAAVRGPVTHVWVEGGRHDIKGGDQQIVDAVVSWMAGL
ncbi:MAG: hypothetical protein JJLCMIEE_01972 [Acidimicrobiales bacterium]|nr:MAG: dienelactone hydrolase [Actinomycetota bacterium]MBV6508905.1 hypothetical protein [Acidimicrobiales bacterium]RIK03932.1 MAG: dienelactone hydrolase [Acidobacteriota bacterium]